MTGILAFSFHIDMNAEHIEDEIRGQHVARFTHRDERSRLQHGNPVTTHRRVIEIMQGGGHCQFLLLNQMQKCDLVSDIEMVGRLVQEEELRLLRQSAGNI